MRKHFLILISITLFFFYCGKSDDNTKSFSEINEKTDSETVKPNNIDNSNHKIDEGEEKFPEIKSIGFTKKAFENSDLQADVHLLAPSDDIEFQFQWFVNDRIVEKIDTDLLTKDNFKQGDWVFYKVNMISAGKKSDETKSKYVRILGSTPILNLTPIPSISIPGEFR